MTGGGPNSGDARDIKDTALWVTGIAISAGYVYIAYLSLHETFTLDPSVSLALFLFALTMLFGPTYLLDLVDAWRK